MLDLVIDKYGRYSRLAEMYQRQKKGKCEIDIFNEKSNDVEEIHDVWISDSDNSSGSEWIIEDSNEYIYLYIGLKQSYKSL